MCKKVVRCMLFVFCVGVLTSCFKPEPTGKMNEKTRAEMTQEASTKFNFKGDLGITTIDFERQMSSKDKQKEKSRSSLSLGTKIEGNEHQVVYFPAQSGVYILATADKSTDIINKIQLIVPMKGDQSDTALAVALGLTMARILAVVTPPAERERVNRALQDLNKEQERHFATKNSPYSGNRTVGNLEYTLAVNLTDPESAKGMRFQIQPIK